jgi:alanine racemase
VGYGARFRASRPSRIGVIAAGYADGYPRCAPDGTPVWIAGRRVPIAGRVSMDLMTIDLTDHPEAVVGAGVELWGEHLPIDEVARSCGTVGYELMTAVMPRVPRKILHGQR